MVDESPVHVFVEVYAYYPEQGWSDALASADLVANEAGMISE